LFMLFWEISKKMVWTDKMCRPTRIPLGANRPLAIFVSAGSRVMQTDASEVRRPVGDDLKVKPMG
jgi:hypothetical protein